MKNKRLSALLLLILFLFCMLPGCGTQVQPDSSEPPVSGDMQTQPDAETGSGIEEGKYVVTLTGDVTDGSVALDLAQLSDSESSFSGTYSVINNWPTKKFCAAEGVLLSSVLKAAGAYDTFQQITVCSSDGYNISFTREQVLAERMCYPGLNEDDETGAVAAPMILAVAYTSDVDDGEPQPVKTTLVFGQEDIYEHNSPAFVEDVVEISVTSEDPGQWEPADSFPAAGTIAAGELVKLQHTYSGLAKLYYTTDGTDPTPFSAMYNPSTYQPELNVPITVTEDVVIKVLVRGYGHRDSDIAELSFTVSE